jgi:hypothetical protein
MKTYVSFQDLARKENAKKSTGPRTKAGKARSRVNALKHGLSGSGVVLPPDITEMFEERRWHIGAEVDRDEAHAERIEEEAVLASLRLDACRMALRRRVDERWETERQIAVLELAQGLAERPEIVTLRLELSSCGVAWKLERWASLAEALEREGTWTDEESKLALDLLGVPPAERPPDGVVFDFESCQFLVNEQTARLRELKAEVLEPSEESERLEALLGVPHDQSKEAQLYRRYEAEHWRKYMGLAKQLRLRVPEGEAPDTPRVIFEGLPATHRPPLPQAAPAPVGVAPASRPPAPSPVAPPVDKAKAATPAPEPSERPKQDAVSRARQAALELEERFRKEAGDRQRRLDELRRHDAEADAKRPRMRRGRPIR